MSDFLFELGVEEVPVSEIRPILGQLKQLFQSKLEEHLVEYNDVEVAATNKRFMLYFGKINEKANDKQEQIKGPAKRIAYDDRHQPTIALQKFLEFNQLTLADLTELETPKGTYLMVEKQIEGRSTPDILKEIVPAILKELTFSKTMVWNASRISFVRPIKNILTLFDNKLIPLEYADIKSSNFTYGHILLSGNPVEIKSYRDYCELLGKNFVIILEKERKEKILSEIREIEEELNARVNMDNPMLDGYIYNNEYPVVFSGTFDKKYLELPTEIISTFMINEKKLMPVFDTQGHLLNTFVGVSNIPDENSYVRKGNERVIRATFEDAKFFWDNDRKDEFLKLREDLHNVTFHKDLGNFYEKSERIAFLVDALLKELNRPDLSLALQKAALNCKNDLVTRMVREFPSLQGIMGGLYMKEKGESEEIWKAVYGHYEPKGFNTPPLENLGAGILSIADKLDNIAAFVSRDIKISSSKDPYGVRRDATGVIKIIIDFKLDFNLDKLIVWASSRFSGTSEEKLKSIARKIRELFVSRIENIFKDFLKYRYDVVNAVLVGRDLDIYRIYTRAIHVSQMVQTPSIENLVSLHRRLKNIIKDSVRFPVSEEALVEKEEKILFDIFQASQAKIEAHLLNYNYLEACSEILEMKPVIDNFFDKVMVMAEDKKLKENRIGLLQALDQLLSGIADFSLIVEQ
ncbi:MAG: glycine--tRNA ligase subunit beta [Candidatus Omnitrophota bacterium]